MSDRIINQSYLLEMKSFKNNLCYVPKVVEFCEALCFHIARQNVPRIIHGTYH